jgi:hypothetical protein
VYDEALKQTGDDWELWLNKAMCAAKLRDHDGWVGGWGRQVWLVAALHACSTSMPISARPRGC